MILARIGAKGNVLSLFTIASIADRARRGVPGGCMLRKLGMLALLGLVGCGGGGGGDGSSLSISISPNPLLVGYFPNQLPATVTINATVSGSTDARTVYVAIKDSGSTFPPASVSIINNGGGNFSANLTTASDMSFGDHSGTLSVRVCADASCGSVLTSSNLPYTVTVKTPTITGIMPSPLAVSALQGGSARLTVILDGAASSTAAYASISDDAHTFVTGHPITMTMLEPGTYTVDLPVPGNEPANTHSGNLGLKVCGDSSCKIIFGSQTLPYTAQVLGLLAGQAGVAGAVDGKGLAATFDFPFQIALDTAGNLYVADITATDIRKVTPTGEVSTIFSRQSQYQYSAPQALAVDTAGNIYFGSDVDNVFDKLAPGGVITSFGGSSAGGLATDTAGNVYATDYPRGLAFKFAADGTPTQLGGNVAFSRPMGISVDSAGNVYVADGSFNIYKIAQGGTTASALTRGVVQGKYMALDSTNNLLVTGPNGGVSRVSAVDGTVTTVVPVGAVLPNGAVFDPLGIAVTNDDKVFLGDGTNNVILQTTLGSTSP